MTTPERLRRRQYIIESGLAVLLIAMGVGAVLLDRRDDREQACFENFVATSSETSRIRSQAVEDESQAFRTLVRKVFSVDTSEESFAAFREWEAQLDEIDESRAANPVKQFDPETDCQ